MNKNDQLLITPEIKAMLGTAIGPESYRINRVLVEKFVDILDDTNPPCTAAKLRNRKKPDLRPVPPTFLISLFRLGQDEWARTVNCPLAGTIAGGATIENFRNVDIGEKIVVSGKLAEAYERASKTRKMVFLVFERNYTSQQGELVTRIKQTFIRI